MLSDELQKMSGDLTPPNLNFILKTARLAVPNLVQNKDSVTQRPGETWQTDFRILEQKPEIVRDLLSLVEPSKEMIALYE